MAHNLSREKIYNIIRGKYYPDTMLKLDKFQDNMYNEVIIQRTFQNQSSANYLNYIRGYTVKERIIFHIDVNNAFLSWDAVYRIRHLHEEVDLREIPSAIAGSKESRHGIILAKSMPAKAYGIKTAQTVNDALKLCPDLCLVPPRHDLYRQFSGRLMKLLGEYSDVLEQFSIDEAFIDMTDSCPLFGAPIDTAHLIKERIHSELGFTVNIGISSNKLLAKMASDFEKPDKVHTLFPHEIRQKMWHLPVEELFLVGRATKKKLYTLGIHTIGELASYDAGLLASHLGKHGQIIHDYANGIDTSPVAAIPPANKGYGNSTTIDHDVTEEAEAKSYLLSLCETVGRRLRSHHVKAGVVAISIKNSLLRSASHQTTLLTPTSVTSQLYAESCRLFDELWDGSPIRLLGVQTSHITEDANQQLNIFDMEKDARLEKLESAIDSIRSRFGDDSIMRARFLEHGNSHINEKNRHNED